MFAESYQNHKRGNPNEVTATLGTKHDLLTRHFIVYWKISVEKSKEPYSNFTAPSNL